MNKVFKVIWNHATQNFVVVSELAAARGKKKSSQSSSTSSFFDDAVKLSAVTLFAISVAPSAEAAVSIGSTSGNIMYGSGATSDGRTSIAIGWNANAYSPTGGTNGAVAIGPNATANGTQTVALGGNASAVGNPINGDR